VGSAILGDLHVLDGDSMVWRALDGRPASNVRDLPAPVHGAGLAAAAAKLWLFGGQSGRTCKNTLHSFDLTTHAWSLVAGSGVAPKARGGHSMTCLSGARCMVVWGGHGKRHYNDMHR
jgi:hypothetical protein